MNQLANLEQQYKKCRYILALWGLSAMLLVPFVLCLMGCAMVPGTIAWVLLSGFVVWRYYRSQFYKSRRIPPQNITVGQFAEAITARRRRFLAPDGSPTTRSAIELRVIEILASIIAIKPNDIMFTDRLVQDLKMG